jgi:hypothetical protein
MLGIVSTGLGFVARDDSRLRVDPEMRLKKEKAGAENRPREAVPLDAGRDS